MPKMTKRKIVAPKPQRGWQKYRLRMLLLVSVATALAVGISTWRTHGPPRPSTR